MYSQLFKVKAKQIIISHSNNRGFHRLIYFGPFSPNRHIKRLKLSVRLGYYIDVVNGESQMVKCGDSLIKDHRISLEYIKQINPDINLSFYNWTLIGRFNVS